MRCPYCQADDTRVIDSRDVNNGESIRRRRECSNCGRRFTTYERVEAPALIVVKRDDRREEFSPEKLRQKLRVALTKRPIGEEVVDGIVLRVENELRARGEKEIPSQAIGEAALAELKAVDLVGYIRFASVYLQFEDLDDLQREVERLTGPDATPKRATAEE
ncbi:MAG TPA: transcriptional regulator NrdR [Thermomicrobiales bacterium]|nr:transcriptional regulator NrdR [Thermomicrobiales bacterium]